MNLPSFGDVIGGKYRVGEVIAEGGMGVVVEGVHVQLEDAVAIKFLKPDVVGAADSEVVKRFMREARTCIKIRSEHVVRVLDVDVLPSGMPYMVMERLVGRDLDAMVEASGPLPVVSAVDYVLQSLEAVGEAHALGIVHRDLMPANLFLATRADGSPCIKVLDFGISKVDTGADGGMTQTQAVMGSPRYMSPEQLRASRDVDARTDVWAMGVVLYELTTGRAPFDGISMTQIAAAILENVPAPLALREAHGAALEAVVMRCLGKRPEQRFANVAELADALVPFGSATAAVSAARIHGVLSRGVAPPPASSRTTSLSVVPNTASLSVVPNNEPTAIGMTAAAWGDAKSSTGAHRRLGLLAGLAVVLTVVGLAFAVHRRAAVVTATPLVAETSSALGNSPASAAPIPSKPPEPVPTEQPAVATKAAQPAVLDVRSAEPVTPRAVVSSRPGSTPPHVVSKPRATASATPSPVATPASTMWSDRK